MCHVKNYWSKKHDELILTWIKSIKENNQRIQTQTYEALIGVIRHMATQIGRKYYSLPYNHIFIEDAINHCFIILPKFNPERAKAYSFCGTVMKNSMYEKIMKRNKIEFNNISINDDEDNFELEFIDTYVNNIEESNINHNKLLNYLYELEFNNIDKTLNNKYDIYLQYMIKFIKDNKNTQYEIFSLIEYIAFACNITNKESKEFLFNNFGVGHLIEKRIEFNDYDDDFTPIESATNKRIRLNKIKNNCNYMF